MKHYHKQFILLFGAIAVFTYLSIQFFPQESSEEAVSVMEESKDQIQIYVLDRDNTLIPMSKGIKEGLSVEEKLEMMITYMCADQVKDDFSGVLAKGTTLKKVQVQDGIASLYFDDRLLDYEESQELKVLEALTWGATQFPEVKQVQLFLNDQKLTKMPKAHTPIPTVLDRNLGINHFESATGSLHQGDTIVVYYSKTIDDASYLVPKSKRIAGNATDMETVVKEVLNDVSVSSSLSSPLYQDHIDTMDLPTKENETLIVNMNNALLSSDRSAKQMAYESLVLSLADNFDVDEVKVYVDDNVVSIHGSNEAAVSVSSLMYNPIPF